MYTKVGYFPQFLSTLVLRQELSLSLELKDSTRWNGYQFPVSIVTSRPSHPVSCYLTMLSIHISTNSFLSCLYFVQTALFQMSTFHADPFYYSLLLLILYLCEWSLCLEKYVFIFLALDKS